MTGKERISKMLRHEPTDRIALYEHFWNDTQTHWTKQGYLNENESIARHFNFDMDECWPFDLTANLDFKKQIVAETEDTVTYFDGNLATLKRHKHHDTTPEHVDFYVKEREQWEEKIKPVLMADPRRINFDAYRAKKQECAKDNRFFVYSGVNAFECMHPVCGHEHMLAGMALDPEWVAEMAMTYAKLIVDLQKILFEKEGIPDGIWYYEDMGFKGAPFMSPSMYREIIQPAHKFTIEYAHSLGLPVIMHSCGFVEPLLPDMIESGINCLQVIEVKAGMDLLKLHKLYGDKIAFMGGIDIRALYSNDKTVIDAELLAKIPTIKQNFAYALHSDHSIPKTVNYENYCYFIKKGLELGTY